MTSIWSRSGLSPGRGEDGEDPAADPTVQSWTALRLNESRIESGQWHGLARRGGEQIVADLRDDADLLGDRDELGGRDLAQLVVVPARERLEARRRPAGELDDRLEARPIAPRVSMRRSASSIRIRRS